MCEAIRGMIEDGKQEGILLGKQEGISLGKQQGLLIGKQEGAMEKTQQVAYNMYRRGMSAEDAAAICEMELSQVLEWFNRWKS